MGESVKGSRVHEGTFVDSQRIGERQMEKPNSLSGRTKESKIVGNARSVTEVTIERYLSENHRARTRQ